MRRLGVIRGDNPRGGVAGGGLGERPRCRPAHVLALPAWTFTLRAVVDVQRPARREAALGSEPGGKSAQRRVAVVPFISVADAEQLFAEIDEVGLDKPRSVVVHRARPPVTAHPGKRDKLSCVFSRVLAASVLAQRAR